MMICDICFKMRNLRRECQNLSASIGIIMHKYRLYDQHHLSTLTNSISSKYKCMHN
ncbi:hypothetical protein AZA_23094 [Nitrospirillum viridazoti Y2]|nr:hypothetical protein AZA_23094 [Nitrospirillum amazonense Y2]